MEEYIFIYGYVFLLLSSFNINGIAGSFFVKKYGLHNWQPSSVTYLIFWRVRYALEYFKKSLSHTCLLIKFSYGPYTRKPFASKVGITGLCCLFCLCLYHFLLSSVSRFGHPLLITRSDTFFFSIMKKIRGLEKADISDCSFP